MFDSTTEVLTDTGWQPISTVTTQTPIAQFNPSSTKFEGFLKPKRVYSEAYAGKMLCLDGKVSLLVTPKQLLYASRSSTTERRRKPVYELLTADHRLHGISTGKVLSDVAFRMRKAGTGTKMTQLHVSPFNTLNPIALARLLGFAASDGHATRKSKSRLGFHLKKQRKIDYLRHIHTQVDMYPQMKLESRDYDKFYCVYDGLGTWCAEQLYCAKDKTLPPLLLGCSQAVLEAVLDGLKHGDGYQRTETRWEYSSTSRPLVDMIQALGVIAGKPFSITQPDGCYRMYSLGYEAQTHINDARIPQNHVQQVDWAGQVYGMDTIMGVITIRRNNKTLLIGSH